MLISCCNVVTISAGEITCRRVCFILSFRLIDALSSNESGFSPCLVFERGDKNLAEFMQNARCSPFAKMDALLQVCFDLSKLRAELFNQVLMGLEHIHSKDIVHCNLSPNSIMFFDCNHSWKLVCLGTSIRKGDPCPGACELRYASPEMREAKTTENTAVRLDTATDMWSFAMLALELLTGAARRFCLLWRQNYSQA